MAAVRAAILWERNQRLAGSSSLAAAAEGKAAARSRRGDRARGWVGGGCQSRGCTRPCPRGGGAVRAEVGPGRVGAEVRPDRGVEAWLGVEARQGGGRIRDGDRGGVGAEGWGAGLGGVRYRGGGRGPGRGRSQAGAKFEAGAAPGVAGCRAAGHRHSLRAWGRSPEVRPRAAPEGHLPAPLARPPASGSRDQETEARGLGRRKVTRWPGFELSSCSHWAGQGGARVPGPGPQAGALGRTLP